MRTFFIVLLAVAAGCASKPKEATDRELAYEDQSPDTQATLGPQGAPAAGSMAPTAAGAEKEQSSKVGDAPSFIRAPMPDGPGPVLTLIYVDEIVLNKKKRPGAMIFSSDPDSPYIQEKPRPSRVLKPLNRPRMARLLADLRAAGLESLPSQHAAVDAPITGERQLIFIRDGSRTEYHRGATQENAKLFQTFGACEKVLLDCSHEGDGFVEEAEGRDPAQHFQPLNPDR